MKKIAFILALSFALATVGYAQQGQDAQHTKVKKTSTLGQKVHNTFSKNKHYNGYKVKKTKDVNGHDVKTKTKVENNH